uniref:Uncharacterized protein n=1 Tax=Anguilla anguilla TaxID=7936 RepID=A0A0E9TS00_ANGAN
MNDACQSLSNELWCMGSEPVVWMSPSPQAPSEDISCTADQ